MTGGFATIAGTVLAAFINMGIDPALLISASVMAAPAALGFSKLFYPETEKSKVMKLLFALLIINSILFHVLYLNNIY
jgi:nucleoside permease NupC